MKFDSGMGSGKDKKAEEMTIANPQIIWEGRDFVSGCLNIESFEVKVVNFNAAK